MTFKKGNDLWKKGLKARKEKRDRLERFLLEMRSGGTDAYSDLLIALAEGAELTKPQQEFMDRYEGWREFMTAKLARTEQKVEVEGTVNMLQTYIPRKDEPDSK